ncbi:MAG: CorA family divalent cation transporter [Patescibacteria group bacterium]|nr:hypothetical protein [Patescibacteria group bacterium]MDE1966434.1 CorA family divalent cation transporter [Patescibacteria group bacterium]
MVTRHGHEGVVWVDLEAPTREELASVIREFSLDPRIEEEMVAPSPYPLTVTFPGYAFVVLHFPSPVDKNVTHDQEIDIVVGKHFVITGRYETVSPLHNLHKIFETEELLGAFSEERRADVMLARLFERYFASIRGEVESAGSSLGRAERDIFDGFERDMVRSLSLIGRELLHYGGILERQRDTLVDFLDSLSDSRFFGAAFEPSKRAILAEHAKTAHLVSTYRAMLVELRGTNDSLLATKQNDIMTRLTIMALVTFPLSLIAAIFGMNTHYLPIVGMPGDFWIITGTMAALMTCFFVYFKVKRWL